jgi:hypothetical protein
MSCTSLSFSQTHTRAGSFGISITITVPEVYSCTNIQLRLRSETEVVEDWFDYAILSNLVTTINFAFPPSVCYIDVRLIQCCPDVPPNPDDPEPPLPPPGGGGSGPGGGADDPPCALISSEEEDCGPEVIIVNPYRKPEDSAVSVDYNDIIIPTKVNLKITQTSCSDISALLCTVRCAGPPPALEGDCPCDFIPYVDIYSLPQLNIGRLPHGVPLDIDCLCTGFGGYRTSPDFGLPTYTKVESYFAAYYGYQAVGFIDGIGYDSTILNVNSWVRLPDFDNSDQLREWLIKHFRFFGINGPKTALERPWPYTDLFWHPFNFCIENSRLTPEDGVAYVKIVPC